MKNDELIITSEGYFNNAHLGFSGLPHSGLPQIHEGSVSTFLTVSEAAFEQFLERTNLTEASKKSITTAMLETETPFFEIPDAVCVNYLINGDVTAAINVDVSPAENSDVVGVRLSDAEKERFKQVFDVTYSKEFPPLEHALFEASLGKEVPPLALEDCYRFEDWTPIDADNEEMLIRLSPSRADLENMVQRTPLWEQNYIQESLRENDFEVYAYITHNNAVRAEIQPVHFIDGEKFPADNSVVLPLSSSEQRVILDVVDIELAKNNILFRLFDKDAEELGNLLCAKVDREYDRFITDLQGQTVDVAIESAYEIVWKDNINEYCQNEALDFTPQQYIALLSSENTLNEVYGRFLKDEYANSYNDLEVIFKDTAERDVTGTTSKGEKYRIEDAWQRGDTSYLIGQSVNTPSFYYACAMNASMSREYEYDSQPNREKVMSDHADKLAEEDIDRGEAIYGADGYLAFPDQETQEALEAEIHMNAPLILHDGQTARLLGENGLKDFRSSRQENRACAEAIISAKKENTTYGDMAGVCYFDSAKTVDDVLKKGFPAERLGYVIASQVVRNQNCLDNPRMIDGRFTNKVKDWAVKIFSQQENFPFRNFEDCDITSAMHHTLVNSLAESFIDKQAELNKGKEENISQGKKEAPKKSKCDMEH